MIWESSIAVEVSKRGADYRFLETMLLLIQLGADGRCFLSLFSSIHLIESHR